MYKNQIKCEICGKFIKYSDIPVLVNIKFTPDTEYTIEKTEFAHNKCITSNKINSLVKNKK